MTLGAFEWVRRMGVHEAYHLDPTNRLIHWICILIELAAVIALLRLVPFPLDLSLVAIALVGLVYLAADLAGAGFMMLVLLVLRAAVRPLTTGSMLLDATVAGAAFTAAFVFQTRVGHGVFERGIDDTEQNVAEFGRTRNPIPLLLVFYYHALELLFAAGYRPALRNAMEEHRAAELRRIPDDPRRR